MQLHKPMVKTGSSTSKGQFAGSTSGTPARPKANPMLKANSSTKKGQSATKVHGTPGGNKNVLSK